MNPNLRVSLARARELGFQVERLGSEWVLRHQLLARPVRVGGNRKDTPRVLATALRQVAGETSIRGGGVVDRAPDVAARKSR